MCTAPRGVAKPLVIGNELFNTARTTTAGRLQRDLTRMLVGGANKFAHYTGAPAFPSFGCIYPLQKPPRNTVEVTNAMNLQIDTQP
jgi:hypothetical protein